MSMRWQIILLAAIVELGAALRFAGVTYGLPYTYRPDEPTGAIIALRMVKQGDLNPHWFGYPGLMFYINALVLMIVNWFAPMQYPEIITMGVGYLATPTLFFVTRGMTALFSAGAIVLTWLIARRLHPNVAWLAALFVALSPTGVTTSFAFTPDAYALFFLLLSFWGTVRLLDDPHVKNYVIAGIGAGLAIASKYNAGLIVLPLIAAHFWRFGFQGLRRKEIYVAGIASALAFFALNPYAIFDFQNFYQGLLIGPYQYSVEGHVGQEGNAFQWYLGYLYAFEGADMLIAILAFLVALQLRQRAEILMGAFALIYFLAVSQLRIRNERTILLIVPFFAMLASGLLTRLADTRTKRFVIGVFVVLLLITPAQKSFASVAQFARPDLREEARTWLAANVPEGSRLAVEAYAPYLDTRRWVLFGADSLADHPADWYAQNGFEYVVFTSEMFGRFMGDPSANAEMVAKYANLFARYPEVKRWSQGGAEIRLARTGVTIPGQRVAARFGNEGELVELIGYDVLSARANEPVRLKLAWRTVTTKPEPLALELRLYNQADENIATTQTDLFQGKGWRPGMFTDEWALTPTNRLPTGDYRIKVKVVWTRYNHELPAQTWTQEKLDDLFLNLRVNE